MSALPLTPVFVLLFALAALRPPMPRHSSPFNLQFALGWLINEQPFMGLWWLLAGTVSTLTRPQPGEWVWWLVAALSALDILILAQLALRARSARPALAAALESAFGAGAAPRFTRPSWWRIVLLPFVAWRPDVRRIRNRRYGAARLGNRLDVYLSRRQRGAGAPVLLYLHGGTFRMGSKLVGARPLLYRLAARGWLCISANYRLFRARYPDQLADVRAAVAWVRANAEAYGADPDTIFLAGGSAGAHLAATAALSGTDVSGVVTLYGYYGSAGRAEHGEPTSPSACINPAAPPFLIAHGALDTLVLPQDARAFADQLRAVSRQPVAYAELPGAQHNFDFFHSVRCHAVTDAIVRFIELTRDRPIGPPAGASALKRRLGTHAEASLWTIWSCGLPVPKQLAGWPASGTAAAHLREFRRAARCGASPRRRAGQGWRRRSSPMRSRGSGAGGGRAPCCSSWKAGARFPVEVWRYQKELRA